MMLHAFKLTEVLLLNTFIGYESWPDISTRFSSNWIDSLDRANRWSTFLCFCLGDNVCCQHSYDDHISYLYRPTVQ